MASLIRTFDWTASPLGPKEMWSQSLRTTVDIMLGARTQIVLFWGPAFVALYNDAYTPTIGEKHPRALGQPACEHWTELWNDLGPLLHGVRQTGESFAARDRPFYIERHGFGETAYFDVSYSAVREIDGSVAGVLCIVSETSARVQVEKALRDSKTRLELATNIGGLGYWELDLQTMELTSSDVCRLNFGRAPDVPFSYDDLMGSIHPEDRQALARAIAKVGESQAPFEIEYRVFAANGEMRHIQMRGRFDTAVGRQRLVGVARDRTERQHSEEAALRLAAIVESSDDAIISKTPQGTITSWNKGAKRLFQYDAVEIVGKSIMTLVPAELRPEEDDILARIGRGEHVDHFETRRRRKDGSDVWVSLSISPIKNALGRVIGASKIARDITERREADQHRKMLMGELNHRVKNTLAVVQSIASQTLGSASTLEEARSAFSERLINLAKAHDVLMRESWRSADLVDVVSHTIGPHAGGENRFRVAGPSVQLTPGAALAISMALHELATNAAKYGALTSTEGHVDVIWELDGDDGGRRFVLKWVESGGPSVVKPTRQGFGSRLIERALASELQGEVDVEYAPAGVRCTIVVPLEIGQELVGNHST